MPGLAEFTLPRVEIMPPISLRTVLEGLEGQDLVLGLFLLGAGLVFIVLGIHIFKVLVVISFGFVGLLLGSSLPLDGVLKIVAGMVGAAGLAVASTFFLKIAVAVLAGGWSALVVAAVAPGLRVGDNLTLVLAALAFAAVVSLTFILYQEIIAAVMSFEGTLMFVSGLVIFLSHQPGVWGYFRTLILDTPLFMGFVLLSGTVIGFYLQVAEMQKKQAGTSG